MKQPITLSFEVDCEPAHAFDLWATRTSLWWPPSHSRSGDPDLQVLFEPRPGGRIVERASDGAEYTWGEVVVWEPPGRLEYLWHIYGERSHATHVAIAFEAQSAGTLITIVHSGWEQVAGGTELRKRNVEGWSGLVPHFESAVRAGHAG
jgi:Activator of Hsp90 ATPase homolog 1-like protein